MKRAIRYLRFSQLGQSNGSIERQELYIDQWIKYNNIELVDTFIDRGKSAKTFDRPDFIKLKDFITKYHKTVDYLLVDQMDRFSRDAGEAMSMVKTLQHKYNIQIVSVTEGITFDYNTPGSFFRAGLQLLLAEEDNINRSIKIRGGIYTAKAKEGRYVSRNIPFGYRMEGERKERKLAIVEQEAKIVHFIFDAFLRNVPLYLIKAKAKKLGFKTKGNSAVEKLLSKPIYAGMLEVAAFKEYPGGLFPGIHEPIVDVTTWRLVQEKLKQPERSKVIIDDELPLRGVVKCHCGIPLTGAPSRGKSGKYFYYYKCRQSKHNNISVNKAHTQLMGALGLMSLPMSWIDDIKRKSRISIKEAMKKNQVRVVENKKELVSEEEKLFTVEEKWIKNEITKDTYERWYSTYSNNIHDLKATIDRLLTDQSRAYSILEKNLDLLTDIPYVYSKSDTLQKREFVSLVFDNNLYYENGVYRTPTMMNAFSHNQLKMREKNYLVYEKIGKFREEIPLSGDAGISNSISFFI